MKRYAGAVFAILLLSTVALADETGRYLVATKRSFRATSLAQQLEDIEARRISAFETFQGFAASLTQSEVDELRRSRDVRWIEPVLERHAFGLGNLKAQQIPYGVDLIHARPVWAGARSGEVNVVVIDSGIDPSHVELTGLVSGGYNVLSNGGSEPMDDNGHGTHVAGTITAANNNVGIVGVAPGVKLWAVKVLNANGTGTSEGLIQAIDWVVARKKERGGNWVANLSLGSPRSSDAEREAFTKAIDEGVIVVAATGNSSTAAQVAPVAFPAAYPGIVGVGAIDSSFKIASFSNQGPEVDITAPGVDVLSTLPVGSSFLAYAADGPSVYNALGIGGTSTGTRTGEYVYCGLGRPADFPPSVFGRIALIKRGDLRFAEKTRNARSAGAIGVVIFNNNNDPRGGWTLISADDPVSQVETWPVTISLSWDDGELLAAMAGQEGHTITIGYEADDYAVMSGTSMASPHVAAAAALLWTLAPNASAGTIVNALKTTANDRGATGIDPVYGAGVIDVYAAARLLAPEAFAGQPDYTRPTTGRPAGRRGKK